MASTSVRGGGSPSPLKGSPQQAQQGLIGHVLLSSVSHAHEPPMTLLWAAAQSTVNVSRAAPAKAL